MERLQSVDELTALRSRLRAARDPASPVVVISAGTCARASGANEIIHQVTKELLANNLSAAIEVRVTGCHGYCQMEPCLLVEPRGTFYPRLGPRDVGRVIDAVRKGKIVEELLYTDPATGRRIEKQKDLPFYAGQLRTVLGMNERIDPVRIYNYIENDGYAALEKVLRTGDPAWVISEIKAAGLRGRGGAGFPTGIKWQALASARNGRPKILVCNADEGDPGAYMDRSVLEGNPHSILEGMLIGAFATGATEGIIYVRSEYPLAIQHLKVALRQARAAGLIGADILGSGFSFDVSLVKGAGAFVCGEETALMRSIEGRTGEPRQRPPFPIQKGIDGRPTAINNVETWANVPVIIRGGAEAYARTGTAGNAGTKIFSLVGKIRNTGLVEVPMGTTLEEVVTGLGGGPSGNARIKAVQTGGPSGGCIPARMFDLPIDYDSLARAGSIMGSGGMIVMDENTCMVDVARYFMNFLKDESCGKCFTCRKGTQRMYEILDDIASGRGTREQVDLLEELAEVVKDTTMCGLGQTAANPVLSTLRYFGEEYERHVVDKKCDAFVCKNLIGAPCQAACPIGTEAWRYVAHIARGEWEEAYRVIREANPFPSVCARVCDHPCEERCRLGTSGSRPVAIRALKRMVTDCVDPSAYRPVRRAGNAMGKPKVAVVGSGPAGLTAAHYLSLDGYEVTVFEADSKPGGMLVSGIPSYRLKRDVLRKEIDSLLDDHVSIRCQTALGRDFTLQSLSDVGYKAVFLALGAHKSRRLNIEGEDIVGVQPAIQFLKAFNLDGIATVRGRVGVIGGGNSAVDAARVALRQDGVESVTIFYRRARQDMPALKEEIASALAEGIGLECLVSPTRVLSSHGHLKGIECIRNSLGRMDASGRRQPEPVEGTEFTVPLDYLIVTIGDEPDIDYVRSMGLKVTDKGRLWVDPDTLQTSVPGVFAGGDVVTGPNTVVQAIAAGKKAALMIDRYLRGEDLRAKPSAPRLPQVYVEPVGEAVGVDRVAPPTLPPDVRKRSFAEVELAITADDARREAARCLRCDLEFTRPVEQAAVRATGEPT